MKKSVINIDIEIMGGTPVFRGTRIPIQILFDFLIGSTLDDFLRGYPSITREMVNEVLKISAESIHQTSKNPFDFMSKDEYIKLLKQHYPPDQILFL